MASLPGQFTTAPPLPNAPLNVAVTGVTNSSVSLSWSVPYLAPPGLTYNLYRGGSLVQSVSGLTVTDTGLSSASTYTYTVSAVSAAGIGTASSPVTALTTPAAPTGLTVGTVTSSSVALSWTASAGAVTYNLYRNAISVQTGIAQVSTTDTGLPSSTTETYTVSAVNAAGEGPQSSSVQATTLAGAQINFTPGHYYEVGGVDNFHGVSDFTTNADLIASLDTNHVVKGFFIVFSLNQCEGAMNDYSAWLGPTGPVQQCLTHVQNMNPPRTLSIAINVTGNVGFAAVPGYMLNNPTYGKVQSGTGYQGGLFSGPSAGSSQGTVNTVRYDVPATAARIAAAGTALYNQFGTQIYAFNPTYSEMQNFSNFVPEMSSAAITATFANTGGMFDQLRAGMPKTFLMFGASFMNQSDYAALYAATDRNKISVGTYDFSNEAPARTGGKVSQNTCIASFRGGQFVSGVFQPNYPGLIDRRANVPGGGRDYWAHVGADELGNRNASQAVPPAAVGDGTLPAIWGQVQLMQCSMVIWYNDRFTGPPCNTVTTYSGAPANYAGANWGTEVGYAQTVTVPTTAYPATW